MAVKFQPDTFHTVTPFVVVKDVAGVIEFAKKTFDAQEIYRMTMPDGAIAHAEIKIGDSIIMLGDAGDHMPPMPVMLYVYVKDVDTVFQKALEAGGEVVRPVADQFYGDRSGGVKDKSGNQWWISTHIEDLTPEELKRRGDEAMKLGS
jgi:PhnB protein